MAAAATWTRRNRAATFHHVVAHRVTVVRPVPLPAAAVPAWYRALARLRLVPPQLTADRPVAQLHVVPGDGGDAVTELRLWNGRLVCYGSDGAVVARVPAPAAPRSDTAAGEAGPPPLA
jgi:hypothetical protein